MDIQTQMRFNHATLEVALVEFLLKENRIEKTKALKTLNKTFDTLVDIRDANPDDSIQDYVERVFDFLPRQRLAYLISADPSSAKSQRENRSSDIEEWHVLIG